jgi:hypothetical protein
MAAARTATAMHQNQVRLPPIRPFPTTRVEWDALPDKVELQRKEPAFVRAIVAYAAPYGCQRCGTRASSAYFGLDHDHLTARCRGVLCSSCNTRLHFVESGSRAPLAQDDLYLGTSFGVKMVHPSAWASLLAYYDGAITKTLRNASEWAYCEWCSRGYVRLRRRGDVRRFCGAHCRKLAWQNRDAA